MRKKGVFSLRQYFDRQKASTQIQLYCYTSVSQESSRRHESYPWIMITVGTEDTFSLEYLSLLPITLLSHCIRQPVSSRRMSDYEVFGCLTVV